MIDKDALEFLVATWGPQGVVLLAVGYATYRFVAWWGRFLDGVTDANRKRAEQTAREREIEGRSDEKIRDAFIDEVKRGDREREHNRAERLRTLEAYDTLAYRIDTLTQLLEKSVASLDRGIALMENSAVTLKDLDERLRLVMNTIHPS